MDCVEPLKVSDPFGLALKNQGHKKIHPESSYTVTQWLNIMSTDRMTLRINVHGGGCCGVKHVCNFPAYDIMWKQELEKRLNEYRKNTPGQVYEVILTHVQASKNSYAWVKVLISLGFKLVSSNINSNSQNSNFVFHLSTAPCSQRDTNLKEIKKIEEEFKIDQSKK